MYGQLGGFNMYPAVQQQSSTGTHTSSKDPLSINSRVFVGNLNTVGATKEEIEGIFCSYGEISGVSLHKGYGFIQFCNPNDARMACQEDGRMYNGMQWDVNMAAEPKSGQKRQGQKRAAGQMSRGRGRGARGGIMGAAGGSMFSQVRNLGPVNKKPRGGAGGGGAGGGAARGRYSNFNTLNYNTEEQLSTENEETKEDSAQDILVCGWCKEVYHSMDDFVNHRRRSCIVKFTCKCKFLSKIGDYAKNVTLTCATCNETFTTGWDLCHHAQNKHGIHIYVDDAFYPQHQEMNAGGDTLNDQEMNGE